ncbi:PA2169 family four-helix-bundle protein [Variovorax humicola]|uniref:PA2169 family four-helix-bundle protein n=1 Tax=Variovorax humicola TaxID=1769758 RepID=A0ABU8VYL2_9BURK
MANVRDIPETRDANRDPITGTPGAHPVGTGVGAAGGAVAGAAAGALAGPVGAAVGLVAGAVAGGLGGKAVGEHVNPTAEEAYWRESYVKEPYYQSGLGYEDYGPAYELGYVGRGTLGSDFDAVEPTLASRWEADRGRSQLDWPRARNATRAAWERADRTYFNAAEGPQYEDPLSNDDVVDVLNDLLETTRDGGYGFLACAEEVKTPATKQLFLGRAEGCRHAEAELVQLIHAYGGKPAEGGTAAGALHRGWVHVKGSLGANSELSILESCERGEDTAVARYRKALKQNLPADVRSVVQRQADGAQRNHDQIRDLRNAARERRQA